jgi:cell division GTPase FtsZ
MNNMENRILVGLGNTGCNIVKAVAMDAKLTDVSLYAIDSVASSISMDDINRIKSIPIISDNKSGSGRNRERGRAMFEYHENKGSFNELYEEAEHAKSPVIVVTSAAGGTGSGSCVPLCKTLIDLGIKVIPIIVIPSLEDPTAYHMNTNDLFIELGEVDDELTYATFRNVKNSADYSVINNEIVTFIEIVFGKHYGDTNLDSIDDSDLDTILSMPGRLIATYASANDAQNLAKRLSTKVFSGFQPSWTEDDAANLTMMKAFSLRSMFADTDFLTVFKNINDRIPFSIDEYRNLEVNDNNGVSEATAIIAGLPRPEIKDVSFQYNGAKSISEGMNKSSRPSFMNRKKAHVVKETTEDGKSAIDKFKWN